MSLLVYILLLYFALFSVAATVLAHLYVVTVAISSCLAYVTV